MSLVSLLLGVVATSSLRLLAAYGSRVASSNIIEFLTCVTYGMLGALTLKIVLLPVNELAELDWYIRMLIPTTGLFAALWFNWSIMRSLLLCLILFVLIEVTR